MRPRLRSLSLCLVAVGLLVTACSGGDDDASPTTTTAPASSTTKAATDPAPYVKRGPAAVGSVTLALKDGRRMVVWYPADPEAVKGTPTTTFDIVSLFTPQLQSLVPAETRPKYEIDSHVGAKAASGGPFPVVLFAHGAAGYPEQSVSLTTHLASWGFIVAAPTFVERSLDGFLGTAAKGVAKRDDPEVMGEALDLVGAENGRDGSPLKGLVDDGHVAAVGHSAGAYSAYATASTDPRIDSFIGYSVGFDRLAEAKVAVPSPPKKPGMVMLGSADGLIPATSSKKVFEAMNTPKYLVEIADAGHLVFSDICLIGKAEGGLIGIAESIDFPVPDNLKRLATDGCIGDAPPVQDAFGAINDLSTDFLRWTLGVTPSPAGLDDPDIAESFPTTDLTVTAEP